MTRVSLKLVLRYGICFFGIAIMGLGVALTTRASLGTTPLSALPFVASLGFPPSLGFFTAVFNLALVAGQILILRRKFPRLQYLQIPVSCLFALFIDMWMAVLPEFGAEAYATKLLVLAAGTLAMALGIFLEVSADVVMMAGEGAVKMLCLLTRRDFGTLKTCFDVALVLVGVTLSLLLFSDLRGIGEGTAISAIFVGTCVKLFHFLRRRLAGLSETAG